MFQLPYLYAYSTNKLAFYCHDHYNLLLKVEVWFEVFEQDGHVPRIAEGEEGNDGQQALPHGGVGLDKWGLDVLQEHVERVVSLQGLGDLDTDGEEGCSTVGVLRYHRFLIIYRN